MKFIFNASLFLLLVGFSVTGQNIQEKNIAEGKPTTSSSKADGYPASMAVDGIVARESKWMTDKGAVPPHYLEINLQNYFNIERVIIHTGIPENERSKSEMGQAAGFWEVKHFKLQYWDDANWTDIPSTEITENRQTTVHFNFPTAILTYKLRFVAFDGEPINVIEVEVFGKETKGMTVPEISTVTDLSSDSHLFSEGIKEVDISVKPDVIGKTMKYVAYNQAYYLPNSNTGGWLEYSQVNSLRVWTSLNTYVPVNYVQVDTAIVSFLEFEKRKSELRENPEENRFIRWNNLKKIYTEVDKTGTNSMVFDYVLEETNRRGIEVLLQINERRFSNSWHHKWQQWQRFYALAYYAALKGNVSMFAMHNEPNHRHSGPMSIEEWIRGMQIVSDAVRCAVKDVNEKYNKKLVPKFVGPVTAGTNVDWWTEVIKNIRTDYKGETVDYDLIDIFSTHSYNSPAAGYETRVNNIRKIIRDNHPTGNELPVVFTEIGRWMNAYLIDKKETMDSPSLFTEWAGIYTNNMLNGAYGMWAFKFANNVSSSYPNGIKSGHHFTWNGRRLVEDTWNNLALGKPVKISGSSGSDNTKFATDGILEDYSWIQFSPELKEKWIQIDLLKEMNIGSALVYTGSEYGIFTGPDRIKNFKLQYKDGDTWIDIPGASVSEWKYVQALLKFEQPVQSRYFRMVIQSEDKAIVREIKLFKTGEGPDIAKESFDISGIHRTGEVVRLFAKGFKDQRNLYQTDISESHPGLDACTSFDEMSGNYYIWLVQRSNFDYSIKFHLAGLHLPAGVPVIAEAVGPKYYGEVIERTEILKNSTFEIFLPAQTVMLITIPAAGKLKSTVLLPESSVTVYGNNLSDKSKSDDLMVSLDASEKDNNKVSFINFNSSKLLKLEENRLTLLGLNGFVDKGDEPMQIHVYGFPSRNWNEKVINWSNAPYLDSEEAVISKIGSEVFVVGQLSFDKEKKYHYLDVSNHIKKSPDGITFILIRETRHMSDYGDKGRNVVISSSDSENPPVLINYLNTL